MSAHPEDQIQSTENTGSAPANSPTPEKATPTEPSKNVGVILGAIIGASAALLSSYFVSTQSAELSNLRNQLAACTDSNKDIDELYQETIKSSRAEKQLISSALRQANDSQPHLELPLLDNLLKSFDLETDIAKAVYDEGDQPSNPVNDDHRRAMRFFTQAIHLLKVGNHNDAESKLVAAIQLYPSHDAFHRNLGRLYFAQREYVRALEQLNKINTKTCTDHNYVGHSYRLLKSLTDARSAYEQSVALPLAAGEGSECRVAAYRNLALISIDEKLVADAISYAKKAVEADPEFCGRARAVLGFAYWKNGQVEEAQKEYAIAVAQEPGNAKYHYQYALILYRANEVSSCLTHAMHAVFLDPNDARANLFLASFFMQTGRSTEAIAKYREAIRINQNELDARTELARLLVVHDIEEAIYHLRWIIDRFPDRAAAALDLWFSSELVT